MNEGMSDWVNEWRKEWMINSPKNECWLSEEERILGLDKLSFLVKLEIVLILDTPKSKNRWSLLKFSVSDPDPGSARIGKK